MKKLALLTTICCSILLLFQCGNKSIEKHQHFSNPLSKNDKKLPQTESGDWLNEHRENGQNLFEYIKVNPISPDNNHQKIYLQPIGSFNGLQVQLMGNTAEYLEIYFGLKTEILAPIDDNSIPSHSRRIWEDGREQLLAPYILDSILKTVKPADALLIMAFAEKDIYPKPDWNFAFGLSSMYDSVGVSSLYRYCNDGRLNKENYTLALQRLIKTSSHEIGHMFSMKHCTHAVCTMNGSNNLPESDRVPNRLCSFCLSKLFWNLKFDHVERLKKLKEYFKKYSLERDYKLAEEDLKLLQ